MQEGRAATATRYRTSLSLLLLLLLFSISHAAITMSASAPNDNDGNGSKNPLMLEAGPSSVDEIVHKLDMSSGSASIELGPLVVNEDGEAQASPL